MASLPKLLSQMAGMQRPVRRLPKPELEPILSNSFLGLAVTPIANRPSERVTLLRENHHVGNAEESN